MTRKHKKEVLCWVVDYRFRGVDHNHHAGSRKYNMGAVSESFPS